MGSRLNRLPSSGSLGISRKLHQNAFSSPNPFQAKGTTDKITSIANTLGITKNRQHYNMMQKAYISSTLIDTATLIGRTTEKILEMLEVIQRADQLNSKPEIGSQLNGTITEKDSSHLKSTEITKHTDQLVQGSPPRASRIEVAQPMQPDSGKQDTRPSRETKLDEDAWHAREMRRLMGHLNLDSTTVGPEWKSKKADILASTIEKFEQLQEHVRQITGDWPELRIEEPATGKEKRAIDALKGVLDKSFWGPFEPTENGAITDVSKRLLVCHGTVTDGKRVNTGLTVFTTRDPCPMEAPLQTGFFGENGMGQFTGSKHIKGFGHLPGPLIWTSPTEVGPVYGGALAHTANFEKAGGKLHPLTFRGAFVATTINHNTHDVLSPGRILKEFVTKVIESAINRPPKEGNLYGGGRGMNAFEFAAGFGNWAEVVEMPDGRIIKVGVAVQMNMGVRNQYEVGGKPIKIPTRGEGAIPGVWPEEPGRRLRGNWGEEQSPSDAVPPAKTGDTSSILGSAWFNARFEDSILPNKLAYHVAQGSHELGARSDTESGDFWTVHAIPDETAPKEPLTMEDLNFLTGVVKRLTRIAMLNAQYAAKDLEGNGNKSYALPFDRLREELQRPIEPLA